MKITLANGTALEAIKVDGGKRFVQNAQRDVLTFWFDKNSVNFGKLDVAFGDTQNTERIIITGDDGAKALYEGYILRLSLALVPVVVTPETVNAPAVAEERYSVEMAQETYTERRIRMITG